MSAGNRGMFIGALVGGLAAASQWEGNAVQAASSIMVAAASGLALGHFFGKRRSR